MTTTTTTATATAPADARRALAAYFAAARRVLHEQPRGNDRFAEAMQALHVLATSADTASLRTAAGRMLGRARSRLYGAHGHPDHADGLDIRPGRGVWIERTVGLGARTRLATVPATVLALAGDRVLLALEADERVQFWTLACLVTPRTAEPVPMPSRTA